MGVFYTSVFISLFCATFSAPQEPEINDQFETSDPITVPPPETSSVQPTEEEKEIQTQQPQQSTKETETVKPDQDLVVVTEKKVIESKLKPKRSIEDQELTVPQISFTLRVYRLITDPILRVVTTPKVNAVLRNIGTCVVNGAMELFSYYLPAPFMPLIASAAGLVIPFEPVVMLKEKMPVTSYRRAFQTAMSSFLRTFDKYKIYNDDEDDFDPYMTRRFNRRFMNNDQDKNKNKVKTKNVNAE